MRIVLASASPRRRELLAAAGIDFDVDPVDVDESRLGDETPDAYVERVAILKALTGAARHPRRIVLGADTTVVVDDLVLGKPLDAADARAMLRRLSERSHEVLTAVAVAADGRCISRVARTVVRLRSIGEAEIAAYVATGEPMDKAGAYAIQGRAAQFIAGIDGAHDTVVGLPVAVVMDLLRALTGPASTLAPRPSTSDL